MTDTIEYKGYHAKPAFSGKDGCFVGKILGIADSVSFHGHSVAEFRTAFEEAVDDYLALCEEIGKVPEKLYSGQFVLRVPSEVHRDLATYADIQGVSLNAFVSEACTSYLAGQRPMGALKQI